MKEQKCRYNKENVIAMLEQNAIQLLLIKFEEEFI